MNPKGKPKAEKVDLLWAGELFPRKGAGCRVARTVSAMFLGFQNYLTSERVSTKATKAFVCH